MNKEDEVLFKKIRNAYQERDLTQVELSERLNLSSAQLNRAIRGTRKKSRDLEILDEVLNYLNLK